jgi:hypothetical protein
MRLRPTEEDENLRALFRAAPVRKRFFNGAVVQSPEDIGNKRSRDIGNSFFGQKVRRTGSPFSRFLLPGPLMIAGPILTKELVAGRMRL